MSCYKYFEETNGVLRLEDSKMSSFYLVKGEQSALLVDTGMGEDPLLPYIRILTDLPLFVLITHGHGDHMMHAAELETVYMSPKDLPFLTGACKRLGIQIPIDPSHFLPLRGGQRLKLGEFSVQCMDVGGHSPGSMVFYEEDRHLLFVGDAIGSGVGVWMQLVGCLPVSQYRDNLALLDCFWANLPDNTQVYPGHWEQRLMHPSGDNPVCRAMLQDMIHLCDDIIEGRENRHLAPDMMAREYRPVYAASHGRASMFYTDQVIR